MMLVNYLNNIQLLGADLISSMPKHELYEYLHLPLGHAGSDL